MFLGCVIFHPRLDCESTALYYLPLNYIKSHSCLLLMEAVSTGGWIPALMTAGFAAGQLVVLAPSLLFCLKMHWEECCTWSCAFYLCKPLIFFLEWKKSHLAHDSFIWIPFFQVLNAMQRVIKKLCICRVQLALQSQCSHSKRLMVEQAFFIQRAESV